MIAARMILTAEAVSFMDLFPFIILAIENATDRKFMENLYLEHRRLMYAIAYKIVRNNDDVEDVINSACESLIKKISLIRSLDCCSLRSYVVSTVRNTAINSVVKRNRQHWYVLDDGEELLNVIPDEKSDIDRDLLHEADIRAMEQALLRLPEQERDLLRMKYYDELTDQEIAQTIGVNESSVRMYLTRARRHVYEQMRLGGAVE